MNALSHIGHAAQLIREVDSVRAVRWILYTHQKQLKIKPADHKDPEDYVLTTISRYEITNGLTPQKWNVVENAIRIAVEKGVLE